MKNKMLMIALSTAGATANTDYFVLKASIDITKTAPWQKIGVSGKWNGHSGGTFEMNQNIFEQMVSNYERGGIDIVCDYEHQTLWGDIAPASGWILKEPISLKAENGELFALIKWTDKAKEMIANGEYRYLSPVFAPNTLSQTDASNIGWTLHSVALTNKPFLEELGEVRLNKLTQTNHTKEEGTMTKEEEAVLTAENEKLKAENEALKTENEKHADAQAEAKVEAAIAAKKLHPDQKESALKMCKADPAGFDTFMSTAKPMIQVPGDDMFDNKNNNGGAAKGELSPEEIKAATGDNQ
ncbi:phage protease [Sulfuricurvum sp.]|uniref:phage protease n=1 Tax=Sulfuricurvum sp. TaxID=2025608 RepID=UPI00261E9FE4|nr:phage protease [Sulfuricurvum sp.]MDD2267022.1 phage protease [Sulfuricurvum sp.]MDD2782638.1 phage protease [Sulfuricurvum sp.]